MAEHGAPAPASNRRWTTIRTVAIPVAALVLAVAALAYAITKPAPSTSALQKKVAALTSQIQLLQRTSASNAGNTLHLSLLQDTVTCLQKWQNKIGGTQPGWLTPSNGYKADDFLLELTGTFEQC